MAFFELSELCSFEYFNNPVGVIVNILKTSQMISFKKEWQSIGNTTMHVIVYMAELGDRRDVDFLLAILQI